tara:strand:- start:292 stop:414 length:123 start_codon:yes stop_codon:yes gene_type:complete
VVIPQEEIQLWALMLWAMLCQKPKISKQPKKDYLSPKLKL